MRKFVLSGAWSLGLLTAAAVLPSQPSLAYEGRWCAVINLGDDLVQEVCSFDSFELCRQEALLFGMTSFCIQNPRYPGSWSGQTQPGRNDYRRPRRR